MRLNLLEKWVILPAGNADEPRKYLLVIFLGCEFFFKLRLSGGGNMGHFIAAFIVRWFSVQTSFNKAYK